MNKVSLNGVEIYPFDSEQSLLSFVNDNKGILVAINAEKILHATDQTRGIINRNIGYCDGAGAQMALKQKGFENACKIPGCELWLKIVAQFYREKTFYLIGGKPQIIEETVSKLRKEYAGIHIIGYRDGYIKANEERERLIKDITEKRPDVVFVHGDTTTSTAAALAAFYQQIPVGHVEAGLRTHNIYSPWPEEMNRQITGRIATYHFSPTALSKKNLLTEGVQEDKITVTGNTVIDALHIVVDKIKTDGALQQELAGVLEKAGYDTSRLADGKKLVLITGHRRENFGDGFISMCTAIKDLTAKYPYVDFVYPMHLNPNVRKPIHEVFGENLNSLGNMFFIEPLEYLSFVFLMEKVTLVLTDSGGIQEEAPGLGKPVLVMRDTTERPEALDAGTVKLVGTDYNKIVSEVSILLDDASAYEQMSKAINPYGDGKACMRITQTLNVRL